MLAKMEMSKDPIPNPSAKSKPSTTTFDTVRLLIFSTSAGEPDTLAWFKSIRVARNICANEKRRAIPAQSVASAALSDVAFAKTIALATIASELTKPQKSPFANNNLLALTGNIFDFNAVKPSRVMLVAQKVFVKMLKIKRTSNAKEKGIFIPIALIINDSNKV